MKHSTHAATKAETEILCAAALVCYSLMLAALLVLGHTLFTLALNSAGERLVVIYSLNGI